LLLHTHQSISNLLQSAGITVDIIASKCKIIIFELSESNLILRQLERMVK
jgi:hypothetical protein